MLGAVRSGNRNGFRHVTISVITPLPLVAHLTRKLNLMLYNMFELLQRADNNEGFVSILTQVK